MKPLHSNSLLLAWRVAEAEAKRLNAPEIEPIHLLIGLAKVVDLDLPPLLSKNLADRDEILEEFLREVRRLRTVFRTAQVDPAALRRALRGKPMHQRFSVPEAETLHRSADARKTFADADHFAQLADSPVYPVHLLYAVLLHEDEGIKAACANLSIDRKRFQEVASREVIWRDEKTPHGNKPKTRWN
jgi:ATP-dependent Clp protease ATP-binding subunit ClpA